MASIHNSGPSIIYGDNGPAGTSSPGTNPEAGPSIVYQGDGVPDPRYPYKLGATGVGVFKGWLDSPYFKSVDATPATFSTTIIAAAQAGTSGTALTLAAAHATGLGINFPVVPATSAVTAANVVKALALDPGFTTVGATSGAATVTTTAANLALFAKHFRPGVTLLVGASTTAFTAARILSVSGTTITLDTNMPATNASAVVALANGQGRLTETPIAGTPYLTCGAAALADPYSGLARGVSVTTAGANTAGQVTVSGYDIYGYPMTEVIACATASTFYGNKAFKYITSAVPAKSGGGAMTGNISVGTSDVFGFAVRTLAWEDTNVLWAGAWMTASTGWYIGDVTSPATSATKDVRGIVQASTANGPNGSGIGTNASNGTRRLVMFSSVPLDSLTAATTSDASSLVGVTQV